VTCQLKHCLAEEFNIALTLKFMKRFVDFLSSNSVNARRLIKKEESILVASNASEEL